MKRLLFILFVAIMAASCSNDEIQSQQSTGFTENELTQLASLQGAIQNCKMDIKPTARVAILRSAQSGQVNDSLTIEEQQILISKLEEAGRKAVEMFKELGISENEMNSALPISSNLVAYGMMGIELSDFIDFTDVKQYNDPTGAVAEMQIAIDFEKGKNCFLHVLGFDDLFVEAIWNAFFNQQKGYASKKALEMGVKKAITEVAEKYAQKLALGQFAIAMMVVEWVGCYFDVPYFSYVLPYQENYLESVRFAEDYLFSISEC